ncbi:hypothetical protein LTR70_000386 [Exophiala xenobiotica]|uniref:Uncharacterized protein n=1 Tax=Lithohypha guttulata TaxID=1690604 RepID=A0ABR0KQS2_9EURO|nr:hypothetical protein LTR24_000087 [Lithohypha guttulata]KAK5330556.1 hypothetical protein LTR70_000386 [Exophiala xenobiotica]
MVTYAEIQASNALINDATAPRVAVFVGATSGIGKLTIKAFIATGASMRIYLIGRKSSEERTNSFIQELHAINLKAEVIWTEGEISLLAETKRVCEVIKTKEPRIDLLFLTAGYTPFTSRRDTAEGLEISQSLAYYSRMLFILHLLPVLDAAEAPRVISVLAGGLERTSVDLDDIDLKKPGNFGPMKAQTQYTRLNTITLGKLAVDNPNVTFIHSWPGDDESGQRHLFQTTSAAFGGRGVPWNGKPGVNSLEKQADGLFLVNYKCDCTPNAKVVSLLREKAQEKIWDHSQEVLRPYL